MAACPVFLIFPFAMAFAGAMDLLAFRIPNFVSASLAAGFVLAALILDTGWSTFFIHLVAGLAILIVGFAMFVRGWLGGGDAKLMSAAALWLGFENLPSFLLWTALLGGGLAIILLSYRRILPPPWLLRQHWALRLHDPKEGIPYGIALAGAALIVYPETVWMTGIAG